MKICDHRKAKYNYELFNLYILTIFNPSKRKLNSNFHFLYKTPTYILYELLKKPQIYNDISLSLLV